MTLTQEVSETWDDEVKELHKQNIEQTRQELIDEYGVYGNELKLRNFIDLGPKPISIVAFHNKFLDQVRTAFVVGAYYPALTAACALGERILNHLILMLRGDFRGTPEYKRVHNKDSFDNWETAIDVLNSWGILLPKAIEAFDQLSRIRHRTIHFDPETEQNDRSLALRASQLLHAIVQEQFPSLGPQPWFITNVPGESYLKKESEELPFVRRVYVPNSHLVGPSHRLDIVDNKFVVYDNFAYEAREISDEEFAILRKRRATV
jgi:hypothetical protein